MSDVIIRGMKMPTNCLECVFYHKTDPIYDFCYISDAVPMGNVDIIEGFCHDARSLRNELKDWIS